MGKRQARAKTASAAATPPQLCDASDDGEPTIVIPPTHAGKVAAICDFFSTRLLLKRYRKDQREPDTEVPAAVAECEAAFALLAESAVCSVEAGQALDAVVWVNYCADFSELWLEVSHWVSPKKMRGFLTEHIGAEWVRAEEVPVEKEMPPINLKLYKNPQGHHPVMPCLCPVCEVLCNSQAQYTAHAQGRSHKMLARLHSRRTGYKLVEPLLLFRGGQATPASLAPVPLTSKEAYERAKQAKDACTPGWASAARTAAAMEASGSSETGSAALTAARDDAWGSPTAMEGSGSSMASAASAVSTTFSEQAYAPPVGLPLAEAAPAAAAAVAAGEETPFDIKAVIIAAVAAAGQSPPPAVATEDVWSGYTEGSADPDSLLCGFFNADRPSIWQ